MTKKNNSKINKKFIKILFFSFLLLLIILIFIRFFRNTTLDNEKNIYSLESGIEIDIEKISDELLLISREGIAFLDHNGNVNNTVNQNFSTPCIHTNGIYFVTFDRGGNSLNVYKKNKLIYSLTTDTPITNAKINKAGYTVILTKESGYKGCISVYDNEGEEYYSWKLGNGYAIDAVISENCRRIGAAILSVEGGKLSGKTFLVDLDNEKVINEIPIHNSVFFAVEFDNRGNLLSIADNKMMCLSVSGKEKWTIDYDEKILEHYYIDESNNTVLVFTGTNNNHYLEMYNNNGKHVGSFTSSSLVNAIDVKKNKIAVSDSKTVTVINYNGKIKTSKNIDKEAKEIIFYDSKTLILVTQDGIVKLKI